MSGPTTWAPQGAGKVSAEAFLYRWNGARWDFVTSDWLGWYYSRNGYAPVAFRNALLSASSAGYYTATLQIKWYSDTNYVLGTTTVSSNSWLDYATTPRWDGYCQM
jgi:hypothetical protein